MLDIEVVILYLISFFQNMQFYKAVVLVLATVSYEYTLFHNKLRSGSVPKAS